MPGVRVVFHQLAAQEYRWVRVRRFPYVLIFRQRSRESVMVMAVANTSRRPGYWRGRH